MDTARHQERRDNRLSLDVLTEIECLQTENDYLRERLKMAEEKLRASLASLMLAKNELSKMDGAFREERRQMAELLSEFEVATARPTPPTKDSA